ncbi:MAG: hypothetical protein KA250_10550 [Verrucomicrobiales bacterium]|jgi:hypothetical protein|nr:hypothetical protein [Verrucomicrobiales bacterium]MBP9224663.1 hypothetical protein [Verrucomicrobiales bacterium]HQZ27786.1 hypothetical protein [Verrucomicrobiales bacterium]
MFKRVILENWHESIPYICFALIAGAFCVILFRALMMSPSEVKRIAGLPLDSSESEETAGDSFTPEK